MKSRFYAFLIHLLLSALVATVSIVLVFFVWYPRPLDVAVGVTGIFLTVLAVDIVTGPLLTFVVYRKGKAGLKLDLTIIALLQIAALSYGIHTVYVGHPAFIVFNQDRFDITRLIEVDEASQKTADVAGNTSAELSWFYPRWVGAIAPNDAKRAQEILFSAVSGGADLPQLPELYVPLTQVQAQMLKKAKPLSELHQHDKHGVLANEKLTERMKWLPLRGKVKDLSVLIDGETAEIIKVVDIDPWS